MLIFGQKTIMPVTRNALIRYKTIDQCLQNRYRQWTLDDLIEACSEALYEYEGIDKGVSRRSVQADLQMMRSDKLGYNAPIVVVERKYYTYEDSKYSITNIPLTDQDLGRLSEAVEFMKQFQGFSHFRELDGMVQKLEAHIYSQRTRTQPAIDFEKNEHLKGLEHLDALYQAIIQKRAVTITYQSFKARSASTFLFHPYLLKEFRNRWFAIGTKEKHQGILNLALDRIAAVKHSDGVYHKPTDFDATSYFKHAIGVSVSPRLKPASVLLFITRKHAPYVKTKPLHHSQQVISEDYYGILVSLDVQHNFELEKEILGFGDGIKVVAPEKLRRTIKERLAGALDLYQTELSESGLRTAQRRLIHRGFAVLNYVYTQREVRKLKQLIDRELDTVDPKHFSQRRLFKTIPSLKPLVFNKNLRQIVRQIDPRAFLVKAIYFDKPPESNGYVTWHQDVSINVAAREDVAGFTSWTKRDGAVSVCPPEEVSRNIFTVRVHLDDTDEVNGALKVIPGSQNKRLSDSEIQLIVANSIPTVCEVGAGGIQLMKPLLLHASGKSRSQKRRRVLHLEFTSEILPGGLVWEEREEWSK